MDGKIFRNLLKQDKKAIEEWFGRSADGVYTFIYNKVGKDSELATDILQETFLQAIKRINEYDPQKGNMFSWLIALSRNNIKNALIQKNKFSTCIDEYNDANFEFAILAKIADVPLPDEIVEKKETAELVQITLAGLPEKYRNILNQFYYQKKMIKEIAFINKQKQISIKVSLHRARNAFKKAFLENGSSLHDSYLQEGKCYEKTKLSR